MELYKANKVQMMTSVYVRPCCFSLGRLLFFRCVFVVYSLLWRCSPLTILRLPNAFWGVGPAILYILPFAV